MHPFIKRLPDFLHPSGPIDSGWRRWLAPSEFTFLLLFAFFLPFREAPKTIFWALYIVTWLVNRIPTRSFGGPWKLWDTVALAPLASGVLAAAFAGLRTPTGREWLALNDPFMQAALFLCLWRARYVVAQWKALFGTLLFSCVISGLEGLWLWKIVGTNQTLQLKSVGHVNHSAIYVAIMGGLAFAFALYSTQRRSALQRIILFCTSGALLTGVLLSDSRAAVGTELVLLGILCLAAYRWLPIGKTRLTIILIGVAATTFVFGQGTIQKQRTYAQSNDVLSSRDRIWNRGFAAWKAHSIFGVGMGNYREISDAKIADWLEVDGKAFSKDKYFRAISHAHNIFVNTLAERGTFGLLALVSFLGYWGWSLAKFFVCRNAATENILFWGASLSSWLTSTVVGVANTTLHHEHALLSIVLLAGWVSWQNLSQADLHDTPLHSKTIN
jgi:O-antigen ligase